MKIPLTATKDNCNTSAKFCLLNCHSHIRSGVGYFLRTFNLHATLLGAREDSWFCYKPLRKNGRGGGISHTVT